MKTPRGLGVGLAVAVGVGVGAAVTPVFGLGTDPDDGVTTDDEHPARAIVSTAQTSGHLRAAVLSVVLPAPWAVWRTSTNR